MPFPVGKLLVRYLGVPLLTKKLIVNDCKPLISKVKTKISDWKNKVLSYAGRDQLIAFVLSSMQNYWASVFLLPKQVIYEINKILKGFLWCQGELSKGKAKDTLWVKWIYMEKLKGRSICEVQSNNTCTVGWKNILNLRDKIQKHIRWKVGNGKSVNVWHDNWFSVSPLREFIGQRDIYDARLCNKCTVNEIINDGRWKWPVEWNSEFVELGQLQVPSLSEDIVDNAVWISSNGQEKKFNISNIWHEMRCNEGKVDWHLLVWFPHAIPRHSFVAWLAMQRRLMTQDKVMLWKPNDVLKCALCNKCSDSHNHLFFTCDFSKVVWTDLKKLMNIRLSGSWDQILSEMKALPLNRNIWSIVRRIVCNAAVYYVWQKRNNRIFKNEKRDAEIVLSLIKDTVILKLIGLSVKNVRS
ncbi:RNA-directed DNA polymerase, eukaryota, reverse transcriptase zinc-binding domain protein [Tanacetum coccineum]